MTTQANDTLAHFIGGKHVATTGSRTGDVYNPATGEVQRKVSFASVDEVDAAVATAKRAAQEWRNSSLAARTRILFAYREMANRRKDEIARLLTLEHGKVLSDAQGEVQRGLEVIEFACGLAQLLKGELSENVSTDVDSWSMRQPLGVVAGITPFNFPAMVPMWMYPLAIACGNSFVLKPSERDPSVTNLCAELFKEAGLPDGVLNVVHGDKVAVDRLIEHPDVAALSFVGSTPIARYIYEGGAKHGKRVQALGGAKNHMVVLPDADMDLAADAAVGAGFGSAGERCMAISVLVCVGSAADKLLPRIKERMAVLKVGNGLDPASQMGPLITKQHRDRVAGFVDAGEKEGAKVLVDGRALKVPGHEQGFFLGPCLLDEVQPGMSVYREEIFGPVLSVVRSKSYDEAMALIQQHAYGNGTAIFTNDGGAARKFQHDVPVGMVGVNVPIPVPMAYYSFGGWKQSLFGDLHIYGPDGVRFYTRNKVVIGRWPDPRFRGVDLGFPQNK
ncbi:MAG: CoA-acylating methylmalonate-semialdehyde dehydrogenase [Deltaproteobacteria bacterium]|nr:CoA-acylating methylmalonate-semialdehyde dehydrogenase [Deltaproteobacteria bacterium]